MQSLKILHCADLHIGALESFLGERSKQRQAETLITFENIIKLAKENEIKYILIAGDLFDSNNIELSLINRVFECIENEKEINFIYSAGNHDPLDISSPFLKRKLPENLYVFPVVDSYFTFNDDKVRFYGRSFAEVYSKPEEEFNINVNDDDYLNIMCIHGELRSDTNSNYYPITRNFIEKSKMDYIALGHIHKRTESGKINNTVFSYCGCSEGQGFDESGEKGVYICEVSKENTLLSFYKTSHRIHYRLNADISECKSSAEAAEKILNILKNEYGENYFENLYRITLAGNVYEDALISAEEIKSRLSDKVYYLKIKDSTSFKYDYDILKNEPTLKGLFVKNMLEKIEKSENECEAEILNYALKLGLKSFSSEVTFNDN